MKRPAQPRKLVTAENLYDFRLINAVAISPDERQVAYTIETVSADRKKYHSHIHVADATTAESKQYTYGDVYDRDPVWSPDGGQLAFVSTRNGKSGIYLMSARGGSERCLAELEGQLSGVTWTPDSKSLVYVFRWADSHAVKDEAKKKEPPLFRHITSIAYRADGGFFPKDHFHIWRIDLETGRTKQLTRGEHHDYGPDVSPDGKWVAFCSRRGRDGDIAPPIKIGLYIMPLAGGPQRHIPTPPGVSVAPVFSPDGKTLAYLGRGNPEDTSGVTNLHVWTVGVSGKPSARDLIPEFDRPCVEYTLGDLGDITYIRPRWSADGRRVYFTATDTGCSHVFYAPVSGGSPVRVTERKCRVRGWSMAGRGRNLAAIVSTPDNPADIYVIPTKAPGDRKAKHLTQSNRDFLQSTLLPKTKEIWFRSADGTRLQGWLVTPPKMSANRKYPAILQIHGGPVCQYGFTFFHEMLFLAAQGYVVFYTNPRGSTGRGEAFASFILHEWATGPGFEDLMAAADYLEDHPRVDGSRLGVTGGSYGGFMTNWIIGHTDRFRAAVTQRSVVNLASMAGAASGGFDHGRSFGRYPWTEPEWYARMSPLTYVSEMRTPLLIIHSENDFNTKMEQAEQLFTTMKLQGKTVEMVRFPDESHGLSRNGRPDRRIARLQWITYWFDRYLKGRETTPPRG